MIQRLVDSVLGIAKESIKTFFQEAFSNIVRLINGFFALVLSFIPGKATILEGVHGWELRPSLKAPHLPRWMEDGVSSFNTFLHEYADASDIDTESEYESEMEDNDNSAPGTPSSQASRASSFRHERRNSRGSSMRRILNVIFLPFRPIFHAGRSSRSSVGSSTNTSSTTPELRRSDSSGNLSSRMYDLATKQFTNMRDYIIHDTTDRRRGIIEDLQFFIELSIERIFEVLRNVLYYCISPLEALKLLTGLIFIKQPQNDETMVTPAATLGDSDPAPSRKQSRSSLNTDARTCEDVITELGYPYEALKVVTSDGYILLLERIPRRDSQKVVYLQHGMFDSSLGWVSHGVVGSQAFAAYDQGYDVFFGNLRGIASRDHIDEKISKQRYWKFTINELATRDIPALINRLHDIKVNELRRLHMCSSDSECNNLERQPYSLCGIAHSLGGAAMLMYIVTSRLEERPHRFSRFILLSPAGFHKEASIFCCFVHHFAPIAAPILSRIMPGIYIPTKILRMLFNKLARDLRTYPAFGGLVQIFISYLVGGDNSNWIQAIGTPHYNMYDMPGISYGIILHFAQMRSANKFVMYDYGSAAANIAVYGVPEPLEIGENYDVIDIPVDIVAGRKDKLIPRSNVKRHYQLLKQKGCQVSYQEFDYAHVDFVSANREDLLGYVGSRLLLVTPPIPSPDDNRRSSLGRTRSEKKREWKRTKSSTFLENKERSGADKADTFCSSFPDGSTNERE